MRGSGKYRILALLIMRELTQISERPPNSLDNPGKITKTDFMRHAPENKERYYFLGLCGLIDLGYVTTKVAGENQHHLVTLELTPEGRFVADSLYDVPGLMRLIS